MSDPANIDVGAAITPEGVRPGEKVVAVVKVSGRVKGSDQRVETEETHVYSFRDGLVVEVREFLTKDERLNALDGRG